MLNPLINILTSNTSLPSLWGRTIVIVALFAAAWGISRLSAFVARRVLVWHDRHSERDVEATGKIANIKRRETLVSVIRTGIAYAAFAIIVTAFAAQRLLIDILAGLAMFLERWYSVGDTVVLVAAIELQGV